MGQCGGAGGGSVPARRTRDHQVHRNGNSHRQSNVREAEREHARRSNPRCHPGGKYCRFGKDALFGRGWQLFNWTFASSFQYFRTINTRVSVVYIETWQNKNQIPIEAGRDISRAISSFNDYVSRNLYKIDKDVTHLLT